MLCPLVSKRRNHVMIRMMKPEAAFLYDPSRLGERYLIYLHCFYFYDFLNHTCLSLLLAIPSVGFIPSSVMTRHSPNKFGSALAIPSVQLNFPQIP